MAKCPGCGEDYPDFFPTCPSCGVAKPVPPKRPLDVKKGIKGLSYLAIIALVGVVFVRHGTAPQTPTREQAQEQRAAVARADFERRAAEKASAEKVKEAEKTKAIAAFDARQEVASKQREAMSLLRSKFRLNRTSTNSMSVEVALVNASDLGMKDFQVACDLKGQSGSTISTATVTVYRQLLPGQAVQTDPLPLGYINPQVTSGDCRVVGAKF